MIELHHLPLLNSILNSLSAFFLLGGFIMIKRGEQEKHRRFMLTAFIISGFFLVSYLIFHYQVGSVSFEGEGWIRPVYFTILISHIILAASVLPLALITLFRAFKKRFKHHKKIARWTWPIWMYVSVTGVIVYLFMALTGSYDKIM